MVLAVRAGLVAACAAGIVASAIAYRSEGRINDAVEQVIAGRADAATLRQLDDARTFLNPDSLRDSTKAAVLIRLGRAGEAEPILLDAVEREPENQLLWVTLSAAQVELGRLDAARGSYARALSLNSQTPRTALPPPARQP